MDNGKQESYLSVEATLKLRNGPMVRERRKRGLSQRALAQLSGVSMSIVQDIESLVFTSKSIKSAVAAIATVLDLYPDDIAPAEVHGIKFDSKFVRNVDVTQSQISSINKPAGFLPSPLDSCQEKEKSESIKRVLSMLPETERKIIEMRFGLGDGGIAMTLGEVGRVFRVTRERVRQVEARAIRLLQHPVRARLIEDYIS